MSSLFKNILVPIDFSDHTEVAVKQAIELACPNGATIHLLHVIRPKNIWNALFDSIQESLRPDDNNSSGSVMIKMQQWQQSIQETLPNTKVNTHLRQGMVQRQIQEAAREIKPELIIIGKNGHPKWFSLFNPIYPNTLARSTGYPVLTVMKRSIHTKIKTIVVPVGSFIPIRKIELVIELAKKYRAAIHLVTIPDNFDLSETNGNSFLETFRILKTGLTNPIEHHILKGNNFPRAILEYAECIRADLVVVNPGSETRISNLSGKHINDVLATSSTLKILSVEPYHELSIGNGL